MSTNLFNELSNNEPLLGWMVLEKHLEKIFNTDERKLSENDLKYLKIMLTYNKRNISDTDEYSFDQFNSYYLLINSYLYIQDILKSENLWNKIIIINNNFPVFLINAFNSRNDAEKKLLDASISLNTFLIRFSSQIGNDIIFSFKKSDEKIIHIQSNINDWKNKNLYSILTEDTKHILKYIYINKGYVIPISIFK